MRIVWVPRSRWGSLASTEVFIERRVSDPAAAKTEIQVHHTAAVDDDDSTPNRWDYSEAAAYMRRLQWSRPDLGPLPYSECIAVAEGLEVVWLFEGRGILTRGAHTAHHNVPGVGWGVFGNFDRADAPAAGAALEALEWRARHLRATVVPNLGADPNPRGWVAWGHRDSSPKSCPGDSLYPLLADFTLEEEPQMQTPDFVRHLTPARVRVLGEARDPGGGWVINPTNPDRRAEIAYYTGLLGDPNNADWVGFHSAVTAAGIVWGAVGGRAAGDVGELTLELHGTAR